MATEETVQLNEAHAPHQASIDAFNSILESLKQELVKLRHDHDSQLHPCRLQSIPNAYLQSTSQNTSAPSRTSQIPT
jgi:hypothetical protein